MISEIQKKTEISIVSTELARIRFLPQNGGFVAISFSKGNTVLWCRQNYQVKANAPYYLEAKPESGFIWKLYKQNIGHRYEN
jgi:hypothetical protein